MLGPAALGDSRTRLSGQGDRTVGASGGRRHLGILGEKLALPWKMQLISRNQEWPGKLPERVIKVVAPGRCENGVQQWQQWWSTADLQCRAQGCSGDHRPWPAENLGIPSVSQHGT